MAVVGNSYMYHMRGVCSLNSSKIGHTNVMQDLVENIEAGVAQVYVPHTQRNYFY